MPACARIKSIEGPLSLGKGAIRKRRAGKIMDDAYLIRLAKTELREGFNTGDVDRVLAVYADRYIDMSADRSSFYGAEAKAVLEHRLTGMFARYRAQLAVTIYSISILDSVAFDRGCHKLTLTPKKGGREKIIRTRYLEIWHKNSDRQWKITVFIDNRDLPPAMPPREVLDAMAGRLARDRRALPAKRRRGSSGKQRKQS